MKNILVFPCGSELGLEIFRSLNYSKHFKLFGLSSVDDHGQFVYENYIKINEDINSVNIIEKLNSIIQDYKIDFIIPAHDSVTLKLSEHSSQLKAELITSEYKTCKICRSKSDTYNFLKNDLNVPNVENLNYPIFLKPDVGQGSKGTKIVFNEDELNFYDNKSLLKLEYLPGDEYTIDCFTDKYGKLRFSEGRIRSRISNGISVNTKYVKDIRFKEIAEKINQKLNFRGVWFFQVKERINKDLVLMEISPRISGTSELFRMFGVNLIELSLFDRMGENIQILFNNLNISLDRALQAKFENIYFNNVYIDLDDTIIIDDKVNIEAVKFLYKCKNNNKKIFLITRNQNNIKEICKKYFIEYNIFNCTHIVKPNELKSDYIKYKDSIFIDDSFRERLDVFYIKEIPVFDVGSIDSI